MKITVYILFFVQTIGCFGNNQTTNKDYFYLDTYCHIHLNNGAEKYLYIQTDILHNMELDEDQIENYINDFKSQIIQEFPYTKELLNHVVLRHNRNKEVLKVQKKRFRLKFQFEGYTIGDIVFDKKVIIENQKIDGYLEYISHFGFSGVVLVAENNNIIHYKGYGWSNPYLELCNNISTYFNIGSIAKSFTAHAVLQLVRDKKISLRTTLDEIFDPVPIDKKDITIGQLLTHSSGYKRNVLDLDEDINSYSEAKNSILKTSLSFMPGETYNYSNAGYQLLGLIVESISKQPIDEYLKKNILNNIGTENIHFFHDNPKEIVIASGMNEWKSEKFKSFKTRNYSNLASTGILATAEGLYNWFSKLKKDIKLFNLMSSDQYEDKGYGFFIKDDIIYSTGDHYNYHTLLQHDKSKNRTIIVLSNISLYNFGVHRQIILKKIEKLLDKKKLSDYPVIAHGQKLKQFQGNYADLSLSLTFEEINKSPKMLLRNQESIDLFYNPDNIAKISISNKEVFTNKVIKSIIHKKRSQLALLVGNFYTDVIMEDVSNYEQRCGQLKDIDFVGTQPLPWNSPNYQSLLLFKYKNKTIDVRIVWEDENIYEILTETDHPIGFPISIVKKNENKWLAHDFITNKSLEFEIITTSKPNVINFPKKNISLRKRK